MATATEPNYKLTAKRATAIKSLYVETSTGMKQEVSARNYMDYSSVKIKTKEFNKIPIYINK